MFGSTLTWIYLSKGHWQALTFPIDLGGHLRHTVVLSHTWWCRLRTLKIGWCPRASSTTGLTIWIEMPVWRVHHRSLAFLVAARAVDKATPVSGPLSRFMPKMSSSFHIRIPSQAIKSTHALAKWPGAMVVLWNKPLARDRPWIHFRHCKRPKLDPPPRDGVELRSNGGSPLVNYEEAGRASGLEFAKLEVHR